MSDDYQPKKSPVEFGSEQVHSGFLWFAVAAPALLDSVQQHHYNSPLEEFRKWSNIGSPQALNGIVPEAENNGPFLQRFSEHDAGEGRRVYRFKIKMVSNEGWLSFDSADGTRLNVSVKFYNGTLNDTYETPKGTAYHVDIPVEDTPPQDVPESRLRDPGEQYLRAGLDLPVEWMSFENRGTGKGTLSAQVGENTVYTHDIHALASVVAGGELGISVPNSTPVLGDQDGVSHDTGIRLLDCTLKLTVGGNYSGNVQSVTSKETSILQTRGVSEIVFVLDASGSMKNTDEGESKSRWDLVKEAVEALEPIIIAYGGAARPFVVTFSDTSARTLPQEGGVGDAWHSPLSTLLVLGNVVPNKGTPTGEGMILAEKLFQTSDVSVAHNRRIMFVMSDGDHNTGPSPKDVKNDLHLPSRKIEVIGLLWGPDANPAHWVDVETFSVPDSDQPNDPTSPIVGMDEHYIIDALNEIL